MVTKEQENARKEQERMEEQFEKKRLEKEKEEVAIKDLGDSVHKSDVQIKY